jgi:hypothetical protein
MNPGGFMRRGGETRHTHTHVRAPGIPPFHIRSPISPPQQLSFVEARGSQVVSGMQSGAPVQSHNLSISRTWVRKAWC